MKIVLIEDAPEIARAVALALQMRHPEAKLLSTPLGGKGVAMVKSENPDLVVLDLLLPDMSGFEVLKQVRLFSSVPIVILTVRREEADIAQGLEWGADDYIVKPFRPLELLARLQAVLRRQATAKETGILEYGLCRFDFSIQQLSCAGKEIALTTTEACIICSLIEKGGQVVTSSRLAEEIWGEDYPGSAESLRVHIRRLRQKMEDDPERPKLILTTAGTGYLLAKLE